MTIAVAGATVASLLRRADPLSATASELGRGATAFSVVVTVDAALRVAVIRAAVSCRTDRAVTMKLKETGRA